MDEQEKEWERDIEESMLKEISGPSIAVRTCRDCGVGSSKITCPCCGCVEFKITLREVEPTECAFCEKEHYNDGKHLCEECEEQHEADSLKVIYELLDEKQDVEFCLNTAEFEKLKLRNQNNHLESRNKYLENGLKVLTLDHTKLLEEIEELKTRDAASVIAEIKRIRLIIDYGALEFDYKNLKIKNKALYEKKDGLLVQSRKREIHLNEIVRKLVAAEKERNDLKRELIKLHTRMEHSRIRTNKLGCLRDGYWNFGRRIA